MTDPKDQHKGRGRDEDQDRDESQARDEGQERELFDSLRAEARGGRIACATALAVAGRLGRAPREVGRACDRLGLKIVSCQLGCFGLRKGEKRARTTGEPVRPDTGGKENSR